MIREVDRVDNLMINFVRCCVRHSMTSYARERLDTHIDVVSKAL